MSTPFHIERILFPTDFSTANEGAADYIAGLAKELGASVSLLHVIDWIPGWQGTSALCSRGSESPASQQFRSQRVDAEQAACAALVDFSARYFDRVRTTGCVKSGSVSDSIIEHASDMAADLVMMPTRGLGPLRRFLIGSTTAKVLHDMHRPLWITPHARELGEFSRWQHVVCAVDYRALAPEVLMRAQEVADLFGGRLTVVSAVPEVRPSIDPTQKTVRPMKREVTASLETLLLQSRIHAELEVLEGSVGEVVREGAILDDADVIVIGHGHLDEPMGHLRTHAYEIIWNAPCPVLKL